MVISLRTWLALGFIAVLLGGAWMLKRELQANAVLKGNLKQLEELQAETEDNVWFQQQLGLAKDQTIGALMSVKTRNAKELASWKERYEQSMAKPENRQWGDMPIPADVRDLLRRPVNRGPDKVRAGDEARELVRRLRDAEGASAREDKGVAHGAEGNGNSAGGLRGPSDNRSPVRQ